MRKEPTCAMPFQKKILGKKNQRPSQQRRRSRPKAKAAKTRAKNTGAKKSTGQGRGGRRRSRQERRRRRKQAQRGTPHQQRPGRGTGQAGMTRRGEQRGGTAQPQRATAARHNREARAGEESMGAPPEANRPRARPGADPRHDRGGDRMDGHGDGAVGCFKAISIFPCHWFLVARKMLACSKPTA